jgi:hypothetical protein
VARIWRKEMRMEKDDGNDKGGRRKKRTFILGSTVLHLCNGNILFWILRMSMDSTECVRQYHILLCDHLSTTIAPHPNKTNNANENVSLNKEINTFYIRRYMWKRYSIVRHLKHSFWKRSRQRLKTECKGNVRFLSFQMFFSSWADQREPWPSEEETKTLEKLTKRGHESATRGWGLGCETSNS